MTKDDSQNPSSFWEMWPLPWWVLLVAGLWLIGFGIWRGIGGTWTDSLFSFGTALIALVLSAAHYRHDKSN